MALTLPSNVRGPILTLTLPESASAVDVILRNVTTGKTLKIKLPAAWTGIDLILDFRRLRIVDPAGGDRSALLDPNDHGLWSTEPLIFGSNDVEVEVIAAILSSTKSPGTVADDGAFGSVAWTNPTNAKASDNSYATAQLAAAPSHYLKATNYNFALPTCVVVGIKLESERKASSEAALTDQRVRLVKAGAIQTPDKAALGVFYPATDATQSYGGKEDLWEGTWTAADINASTFGSAVAVQKPGVPPEPTASIDHMPITVYYRPTISYAAKATLTWDQGYV